VLCRHYGTYRLDSLLSIQNIYKKAAPVPKFPEKLTYL